MTSGKTGRIKKELIYNNFRFELLWKSTIQTKKSAIFYIIKMYTKKKRLQLKEHLKVIK